MLEPWTEEEPAEGSHLRAVASRSGFDLEPALPDPAPAYLDPSGTLHPALTEPLGVLPLHRFPTPGARAALVARILSDPQQADPEDSEDPFVALYRYTARQDMEPEVTGSMALVLLRAHMHKAQRQHRPRLPDPQDSFTNPELDPFAGRRARLSSTNWDSLWEEISAAHAYSGDDPAFAFERENLKAAVAWLSDYRKWVDLTQHLTADERVPQDRAPLLEALATNSFDLGASIAQGVRAEQEFMDLTVARPQSHVDADWLLAQQVRSLRNLDTATHEHSLQLHQLMRQSDVARVRAQLAYRVALLRLWTSEEPDMLEEQLLAIEDPPHPTTLGAGLGRVVGTILLRRLRRGDTRDAQYLADRALALAPAELAVRITSNDLRYAADHWDEDLLSSLRTERSRWDSVTVCYMGARVADRIGQTGPARHFRQRLVERALQLGSTGGWALAVTETLQDPKWVTNKELLESLADQCPKSAEDGPLLRVVVGASPIEEALEDLEVALLQAGLDLQEADTLDESAIAGVGKRKPAVWQHLVTKKLVGSDQPDFAGRLWSRIQSLRAASPALRTHPLAGALRGLQSLLAAAVDAEVPAQSEFEEVMPRLAAYLHEPEPKHAEELAQWLTVMRDPLRIALREPTAERIARELRVLTSRARLQGLLEIVEQTTALKAGLADPAVNLDAIDEKISSLITALEETHKDPTAPSEQSDLMAIHPEFDQFSSDELGIRPEALRRARQMVRLFNLSGGKRDRKRLKGRIASGLFELRQRTAQLGGIRVFYRREAKGWLALAAMSKYDDRQQQEAIERVANHFASIQPS